MYKYIELDNNIRIGLFTLPEVRSVALKAMLYGGPAIEKHENNGASHFIEHLLLAGTKKRPNKLDFAIELESLGISYNGSTNDETISFTFDVPFTNTVKSISILKEVLFDPLFDDEIIEKERKIIIDEIVDKENYPDLKFYYKCMEHRFLKKDHALARRVGGTKEIINAITKKQLIDLYEEVFVPDNLFLSIVGNFDIEEVETHIRKLFSIIRPPKVFKRPHFNFGDLSEKVLVIENDANINNVYSNISFKGLDNSISIEKELYQQIFTSLITGMRTSRLFQDVREKEGLVYNISSYGFSTNGVGYFNIGFESDAENLSRIYEIIFKDLDAIKKDGFTNKELDHVLNYLNNRTLLGFSTPWSINNWIMSYIFELKKVIFPEDIISLRSKSELQDISAIVTSVTNTSNMNIISLGTLDSVNLTSDIEKYLKD